MVNTMITSMPVFVCGILSALLGLNIICRWDRPRFQLLLFMLATTLIYIGHFVFFNRIVAAIPLSDTLYSFCNPAVYPLFFIYIEELVVRTPNRRRQLLYLLPACLCGISVGMLYMMMNESETAYFVDHFIYGHDFSTLTGIVWWQVVAHLTVKIVFALEILPVLIIGMRHISNYNHMIENYYSNTEDKTLSPIKLLLVLLVITSLISFVCNFIGRNYFVGSVWMIAMISFTFSVLILLIGYNGLFQNFSIANMDEEDETPITASDPISHDATDRLASEIRRLMEKELLYLQPNLKINDLAMRLNTNRNYIYNAINGKIGMSFSEFVNQKRIEYAVKLMENNPNLYLTEITHRSGFSSESSFYRNFKMIMGCSPSEYQKKQGRTITASTLQK